MNYHNITKDDMLNGDGLRVVLWVAGCEHHCPFCQNPETHNPESGIEFDKNAWLEICEQLDKDYIDGITLSGGDVLAIYNRQTITELAKEIKNIYPHKTIWCYTGYTFEEIKDLEIMKYIDVLVDGRFIIDLKEENLKWRGSSNQRVIDIQNTLKENKVILYCN